MNFLSPLWILICLCCTSYWIKIKVRYNIFCQAKVNIFVFVEIRQESYTRPYSTNENFTRFIHSTSKFRQQFFDKRLLSKRFFGHIIQTHNWKHFYFLFFSTKYIADIFINTIIIKIMNFILNYWIWIACTANQITRKMGKN